MSERWEEAIQKWYSTSHTANLDYLDLTHSQPSVKELAHNLSIIYDRICLSSRVHIKNLKQISEKCHTLEIEIQRQKEALQALTSTLHERGSLLTQKDQRLVVEQQQSKEILQIAENINHQVLRIERLLQKVEGLLS